MCSTPQVVFEGFVTRSLYTRFLLKVVSRDAKGEGIVVETDKAPLSDRLLEKWFRATPRAKALSLSPIRRLCLIVSLVADAGVREHPDKHPQDTKPRRRSRDWTCRENAKSGFGVLPGRTLPSQPPLRRAGPSLEVHPSSSLASILLGCPGRRSCGACSARCVYTAMPNAARAEALYITSVFLYILKA